MISRLNPILQLMNPDNSMNVNRLLAHAIGVAEVIIYSSLISKSLYYEKEGMISDDGWFFSTIPDLQASTTYMEKAQRSAIKHLVENELIECKTMGIPARRYFRILNNTEKIGELILIGSEKEDQIKNNDKSGSKDKKTSKKPEKSSSALTSELVPPICPNLNRPDVGTCSDKKSELINLNLSNPNLKNPNQSIYPTESKFQENVTNQPKEKKIDGLMDFQTKSFTDIISELGVRYVYGDSEKDYAQFSESDRKTKSCQIPYEFTTDTRNMDTALKYLFAYSYRVSDMEDSEIGFFNGVISVLKELCTIPTSSVRKKTIKYHQIIDALNTIIRMSSLFDWYLDFVDHYEQRLAEKQERHETISYPKAFLKSCVASHILDYDVSSMTDELIANGMFKTKYGSNNINPNRTDTNNNGYDYNIFLNNFPDIPANDKGTAQDNVPSYRPENDKSTDTVSSSISESDNKTVINPSDNADITETTEDKGEISEEMNEFKKKLNQYLHKESPEEIAEKEKAERKSRVNSLISFLVFQDVQKIEDIPKNLQKRFNELKITNEDISEYNADLTHDIKCKLAVTNE